MPDVHIERLVVRFGATEAVRDVSLDLAADQITVILGPSGSGKSTLLRSIAGLIEPTSGTVRIGDRVLFDADRRINISPEARLLGMVFQSHALWPHMRVWENVAFPLRQRRVGRREARLRSTEILQLVGLRGFEDRYPGQLSGGESQRVSLARALAYNPVVLLFDEPLSSLDAPIRAQMRREISRLQDELQTTMVYVTHDRSEAEELAETLVVMKDGGVVERGPAEAVLTRPRSPFTADFLLDAITFRGECTGDAVALTGTPVSIPFTDTRAASHLTTHQQRLYGLARTAVDIVRRPNDGLAVVAEKKHSQGFYRYSLAFRDLPLTWDVLSNEPHDPGDRVGVAIRPERMFELEQEMTQ